MPQRVIAAILLIWAALALAAVGAFFGIIYFSGVKSTLADRFGDAGKIISVVLTLSVIPLFNLGRFLARRRRLERNGPTGPLTIDSTGKPVRGR